MNIFGIGMPELLIILFICLLVFGASKLPEIGRSFGKTISNFKKGLKDDAEQNKDQSKDQDKDKPGKGA